MGKSVEEIYQKLLADVGERAGFVPNEGCDLAVRLWAAAAQLQALDIQGEWVLDQGFPQTAQGVYLDYHAQLRGLSRTPAARAAGTIRFAVRTAPAADMQIPAGTVCMTETGVRFQTTAPAVLAAGSLTADAPAVAVEGGSSGNAVTGAVSILTACPVAVTGCTNPAPFTGGSDQEGDEALRRRILESYQRLPNGANAAWYQQTALACPGVAAARVVGRARGIGTVDVYIAGENGLPSEALRAAVQAEFQEKREIAVDVAVKAPRAAAVDVAVAVAVREGAERPAVLAAVEQALADVFGARLLGRAVRLAELGSRVYGVEGVENYAFSAPLADLEADDAVLPVLGMLTVTEMEGTGHV